MYSLDAYKSLISLMVTAIENINEKLTKSTIRLTYSGRGMYGINCLGVTLNGNALNDYKFELFELIGAALEESSDKDTKKLYREVKRALRRSSTDNMGLDMIEYYPTLNIPKEYHAELKTLLVQPA